jgi:hypothetical protein
VKGGSIVKIKLINTVSNTTSRGVLSKAWYMIDDKLCMVKGNSITPDGKLGYEPYSEVMAAKIAELLSFNHVDYWLADASLFHEVATYGIKHVSVCENYLKNGQRIVKFEPFMIQKFGKVPEAEDVLRICREYFKDNLLDKMFLLDAFIGNEDRHLNNFEIIRSPSLADAVAPIYDCGAGLLSWRSDSELAIAGMVGRLDKAKPFRSSHSVQINLVENGTIPKIDLAHLYQTILVEITPILSLLSERRARAIQNYLKWRLKYLEKVMITDETDV